jgi:hypothetical protein
LIFFSILSPNFFICQIWSLFFLLLFVLLSPNTSFVNQNWVVNFVNLVHSVPSTFHLSFWSLTTNLDNLLGFLHVYPFVLFDFLFFFLIFLGKKWVIIVIQIMIELRMMIIFMMIQESLQDLINIRGPFHECRHQVDDLHILHFIIMLGRNNCKLFNCKILYKCLFACNNLKRGRLTSYPKWD